MAKDRREEMQCGVGSGTCTEVTSHGKEGEVDPSEELGDRKTLFPLLELVEDLQAVAGEHDNQDVCRMRIGEGQDEQGSDGREEEEQTQGCPGGDEASRKGPGAEEPPVACQPVIDISSVIVPVDVIVEDESCFESKESDQGD
jgi:hypothetical protein